MLRQLRSYFRADSAAVMPMMAMLFPVIIAMAGLGVDVSYWMMQKRKLQTAADAAAYSAGFEIANSRSQTQAESAGLLQAQNNGYTSAGGGTLTFGYATNSAGNVTVTVNAKQKSQVWFSDLFVPSTMFVSTVAAVYVELDKGPYCILSLDPNAHDAVSVSGTVTVNAAGCGVAVNSTQSDALYLNGNVFVNVGNVHLAGDKELVGNSYVFNYTGMQTNASATADPYVDLTVPSVSEPVYSNQTTTTLTSAGNSTTCTDDQLKTNNANKWTGGTVPLLPGRYCGGINVSGASTALTLAPGVYVMDGGSFNMSGGGTVSCPTCNGTNLGVTIILTNTNTAKGSWGSIDISGGSDVYIPAPNTDPTNYPGFSGIAIYQDRNCGTLCADNTVRGNSSVRIGGVAYAPNGEVNFGGTTTTSDSDCTKIIGKTVVFHGTPQMGNNCTNSGTKNIGTPMVKLVL